jgi:hypothetical protein
MEQRNGVFRFTTTDIAPLLPMLAALPVADLAIEPPSLEDVFLTYYEVDEETADERR